jgi:hypothetical protein
MIGSTHFLFELLSRRLSGLVVAALESIETSEGRSGLFQLIRALAIANFFLPEHCGEAPR